MIVPVLESLEPGLDSSAVAACCPKTALEACPPIPVEVRYALRVLAEQDRFGR
jgi:hypothetical protein